MVKCEICGKEFSDYKKLSCHIKIHKLTSKQYYDLYIGVKSYCKVCGKETKFISMSSGYCMYCSYECTNKSDLTKIKRMKTNQKRFGSTHFFSSTIGKEKVKEGMIKKFGNYNPMKVKIIKEKLKNTNIERYGVNCVLSTTEVKNKIKQTCFNKYGASHHFKYPKILTNRTSVFMINMYKKIKSGERTNYKYIPLFSIEEYKGSHHKNKYSWFCLKCSTKFKDHIDDGHIPRCPTCYPIINMFSKMEKEIAEYIQSLGIIIEENNRTILSNNQELDIYIPSHNLAIEFDGLYWHSENGPNKIDQFYHLEKTEQCESKGIQLLHIFEDEWVNKSKIVKSMIHSKLGLSKERIYARKCNIIKLSFKDAKCFLNKNHIQGCGTPSKLYFGLMYNMNLIAVASFSKPRYNKNYDYELIRYSTKINTSVIGGFSKLLKHFIKEINPKNIISYADRRYSNGNVYKKCGFKELRISKPNYFYIEEDMTRSSRVKYQKHKLSTVLDIFDPNLTAWQNMQLNGYDRIWDCGNLVFLYKCE